MAFSGVGSLQSKQQVLSSKSVRSSVLGILRSFNKLKKEISYFSQFLSSRYALSISAVGASLSNVAVIAINEFF